MIMTSAVEARIHAVAPESIAIFHLFFLICIGYGNAFDTLDQNAFAYLPISVAGEPAPDPNAGWKVREPEFG
jgi:hypothetical protein